MVIKHPAPDNGVDHIDQQADGEQDERVVDHHQRRLPGEDDEPALVRAAKVPPETGRRREVLESIDEAPLLDAEHDGPQRQHEAPEPARQPQPVHLVVVGPGQGPCEGRECYAALFTCIN